MATVMEKDLICIFDLAAGVILELELHRNNLKPTYTSASFGPRINLMFSVIRKAISFNLCK